MTAPADLEPRFNLRRFLLSGDGWPYLLVPFIPVAIVLELLHAGATPIFVAAALGVIPTAALMGRSTEELAARSGPGIGSFLNVTFGNFPELVIALFALREGLQEVVKASIVGSILGNILLVMGAAMLVGGLRRDRQYFDRTAANVQSLMLLLAAVALVMPAIFELVAGAGLPRPTDAALDFPADLERLSVGVSLVLLCTYAAGLVFGSSRAMAVAGPNSSAPSMAGVKMKRPRTGSETTVGELSRPAASRAPRSPRATASAMAARATESSGDRSRTSSRRRTTSTKARTELAWQPSVDFAGLIGMMVDADLERVVAAPRALDRLSTQ